MAPNTGVPAGQPAAQQFGQVSPDRLPILAPMFRAGRMQDDRGRVIVQPEVCRRQAAQLGRTESRASRDPIQHRAIEAGHPVPYGAGHGCVQQQPELVGVQGASLILAVGRRVVSGQVGQGIVARAPVALQLTRELLNRAQVVVAGLEACALGVPVADRGLHRRRRQVAHALRLDSGQDGVHAPEALKVLIRTFHSVFPHTSVWYMINLPTDFVILAGTANRLEVRLGDIEKRIAAPLIQRDLAAIGMDNPYKLAACLLLAERDVERFVGGGPIHHDERPVLDYMTHATPYRNTLPVNLKQLVANRSDVTEYVVTWPGGQDVVPDERWAAWYEASNYLIEGHAALRASEPDHLAEARAAYEAATDLIPDDQRTRALARELASPR